MNVVFSTFSYVVICKQTRETNRLFIFSVLALRERRGSTVHLPTWHRFQRQTERLRLAG